MGYVRLGRRLAIVCGGWLPLSMLGFPERGGKVEWQEYVTAKKYKKVPTLLTTKLDRPFGEETFEITTINLFLCVGFSEKRDLGGGRECF